MRIRPRAAALVLLFLIPTAVAAPAFAADAGHCAPVRVTPVPGDPGAWRIETPHGVTIARRSPDPVRPAAATALAVIRIFPGCFDSDGDTLGTVRDTILVAPGTIVRWVRMGPGVHTITNGVDSGDPGGASEYNEFFDDSRQSYERAFTKLGANPFFCYIHGAAMSGMIFVTTALADAGGPGLVSRAGFTRSPSPNPTRDAVAFAIALPRSASVRLVVHDVAGRLVATLHDGPLPAGEHPFRWDGRAGDGRRVESGRYFVAFTSGDVRLTRAVSIVR